MPTSKDRIAGFDWLRVLALGLVLVFHILVLLDLKEWTHLAGMSIGSLGVTLFLGISGALIGCDSRNASAWLVSRLKKIFPAYWLVTSFAFLATAASGYKQVSVHQFLWQMSGIGFYFAEDLINIATWFIGLLLTLYLSVFLARLLPATDKVLQLIAFGASILVMLDSSADYFGNCFAFYGAILAFKSSSPAKSLLLLSAPCLVLSRLNQEFLSIALVWSLIASCLTWKKNLLWIALIARYSYEFYLVHGIFLVGCMKLFRAQGISMRSILAVLVAVLASSIAAISIQTLLTIIFNRRSVNAAAVK